MTGELFSAVWSPPPARHGAAYTRHEFVRLLARGDLPEAAFRRYLVQDYLFLIHFARAWGLAVYKSDTFAEMRRAQSLVAATLDVEIGLHIEYCRGWGLSEAAMAAEPEAPETVAYTRFVLDRGLAGDRLDLEVALAPCIVGYAEIARRADGRPGDQARRQSVPRMARNVCRRRVPGAGARSRSGARRAVCPARRRGPLPGAGRRFRDCRPARGRFLADGPRGPARR